MGVLRASASFGLRTLLRPAMAKADVPVDLCTVKRRLSEHFGLPEDDDLPENAKLDAFLTSIEGFNFYDYVALIRADPNQTLTQPRSFAKIAFLPVMQMLIPIMVIASEVKEFRDHHDENGICPDNTHFGFRMIGFVMMIYSVWHISDGILEKPTYELTKLAARHFAISGQWPDLSFVFGFLAQAICGLCLVIALYLLFATSKMPIELVINAVALNFLLEVDNQWVTGMQKAKGRRAATYLFKNWRDVGHKFEEDVTGSARKWVGLRRHAETVVGELMTGTRIFVLCVGYASALLFLGCDVREW